MTDNERDKMIMEIHADIQVMKTKLDNDWKALNGNGQPGLISRVADIEKQLAVMAGSHNSVLRTLGWLITTGLAVYAAFFRRG